MKHVGYYADLESFDESDLLSIINSIENGGSLDVVVSPVPATVEAADSALRKLYAYAPSRPSQLHYTVVFSADRYKQNWERAFGSPHDKSNLKATFLNSYAAVAVGGTFDHLHWGHQLLLSMAAFTADHKLVVGVTGANLLANKKYAEAMDPYTRRVAAVEKFVLYIRPDLKGNIDFYELKDMYGPTVTVRDLDALVVSAETREGGAMVNSRRTQLGFSSLVIIEVGLIGGNENKLSSTDLRKEDMLAASSYAG